MQPKESNHPAGSAITINLGPYQITPIWPTFSPFYKHYFNKIKLKNLSSISSHTQQQTLQKDLSRKKKLTQLYTPLSLFLPGCQPASSAELPFLQHSTQTLLRSTPLCSVGSSLHPVRSRQMDKAKNKKRFSEEQIRSLESMFNSESRPESQMKQQIADQLGLEPRQVAIWFQNRRARCKLKQVEHDYSILKASYDNLATRFEALKTEHHYLISELKKLKGSQNRPKENNEFTFTSNPFGGEESNTRPHDAYARDVDELQGESSRQGAVHLLEQEAEVLNTVQTFSSSPFSSSNCYSLESGLRPDYLPEANCDSEWWESY